MVSAVRDIHKRHLFPSMTKELPIGELELCGDSSNGTEHLLEELAEPGHAAVSHVYCSVLIFATPIACVRTRRVAARVGLAQQDGTRQEYADDSVEVQFGLDKFIP